MRGMLGLETNQVAGILFFAVLFVGLLYYMPRLFEREVEGLRDFILDSDDAPRR